VVLDGYAGSWFIADSSLRGYDGSQVVSDEERSVWQMKPEREQQVETKQSRWGFRGKTFWSWLELLVVPLALAGIGLWFTAQQETRQQKLAEQRAQDEALQAYLDQMSMLILEKDLRSSDVETPLHFSNEDSDVRTLARARTLTVLSRLDPSRKEDVMEFLLEANLLVQKGSEGSEGASVVVLAGTGMVQLPEGRGLLVRTGADLSGVDLRGTYLHDTYLAAVDLSNADLQDADLSNAELTAVNLNGADLRRVALSEARLQEAFLQNTRLNDANLSGADLVGADLRNADLSGADLSGAQGVTDGHLAEARSLEGATMPNGQKYEDWLKDREDGKEGRENE